MVNNINNFKNNKENINKPENKENISEINIENINENIDVKAKLNENYKEKNKAEDITENKIIEETQNAQSQSDIYIQKIQDIILDDGVKEVYESMPIKKQKVFEKELKKTSVKISDILLTLKDNIVKGINKIFELIRKLIFKLGFSDYGYTEKMVKNKVENIIKIKIS
ncbi:MAG TPA: hypothetical protein PLM63_00305 [bacterium]|nr:hypothetical protein [Patescibacteria group bacterium]HPO11019.1 hypothetical protein [bacterium]HQL11892.1 hypothetical protein [bacterium]